MPAHRSGRQPGLGPLVYLLGQHVAGGGVPGDRPGGQLLDDLRLTINPFVVENHFNYAYLWLIIAYLWVGYGLFTQILCCCSQGRDLWDLLLAT